MDAPTIALLLRAVIAVLLILGGIVALRYGYALYRTGTGLQADGTTVETDKTKASLKTVGSVVMSTSIAWAFLGYLASPSYKTENGITIVASATGEQMKITLPLITGSAPSNTTDVNSISAAELKSSFEQAEKPVKINGRPAFLQEITNYPNNRLVAEWSASDSEQLTVVFAPKLEGSNLAFHPTDFSFAISSPDKEENGKKPQEDPSKSER